MCIDEIADWETYTSLKAFGW